jgi:hypothetical protein
MAAKCEQDTSLLPLSPAIADWLLLHFGRRLSWLVQAAPPPNVTCDLEARVFPNPPLATLNPSSNTMSFRWSAGDIVKCVELIVRVSKGLKDSTGASAEYEAAVDFLNGLKTTLDKLSEHLEAYPDTFHGKDLADQAERLKTAVEKFKAKAETFEASLAPGSSKSSFRRAPKKIQWTLFADSIKELQAAILQPQNVLNSILLLQTLYVGALYSYDRI